MNDRTPKALLCLIATLLLALLLRSTPVTSPVQAQAQGQAWGGAPALSVRNNMVYVLQGNELSVYLLDLGVKNPSEALALADAGKLDDVARKAKLQLLVRQDLTQLRPAGAE
jgi:hypothetical protein